MDENNENNKDTFISVSNRDTQKTDSLPQPIVAAGMAAGGGAFGCLCVIASGLTAAGMVGGGAGIGMAAGPVGMIIGAIGGLALYGLIRAFWK
jgi:hypothetical protein